MRYHVYQFLDKTDNFEFLGPNLPKNGFWGRNFKNLSLDSESASLRCYVHQFSDKFAQKWILGSEFQKSKSGFGISTSNIPCVPIFSQNGQLLIFRPKFGEIAELRAIFCFKYCWGCCRELVGGWNELGGGGWSWVELGARFNNTQTLIVNIICIDGNTGNIHVRRTFFVTFIGADCSSCLWTYKITQFIVLVKGGWWWCW